MTNKEIQAIRGRHKREMKQPFNPLDSEDMEHLLIIDVPKLIEQIENMRKELSRAKIDYEVSHQSKKAEIERMQDRIQNQKDVLEQLRRDKNRVEAQILEDNQLMANGRMEIERL